MFASKIQLLAIIKKNLINKNVDDKKELVKNVLTFLQNIVMKIDNVIAGLVIEALCLSKYIFISFHTSICDKPNQQCMTMFPTHLLVINTFK